MEFETNLSNGGPPSGFGGAKVANQQSWILFRLFAG